MRQQERFLPRKIHRFSYWNYFRPGAVETVDPVAPLKHHIKRQFDLILTATPAVWNKEIFPWLHRRLADIPDRRFLALEGYVQDDKDWSSDADAWAVYRQLSPRQQTHLQQLDKRTWRYRSQWTWETLLRTIARDQAQFEAWCDTPPPSGKLSGTAHRIYVEYSKQATILLGGGRFIPKNRRSVYRDMLGDHSSLLTPTGRLDSQSIFWFRLPDLPPRDRREAKKQTLHWFHHAIRNMREYRNNRAPIPWSPKCAETCRRIQKKLCCP